MLLFYCATLAPALLIALGATVGGPWPAMAVLYMTVLAFLLDRLAAVATRDTGTEGEFITATPLLVLLGAVHFALLVLARRATRTITSTGAAAEAGYHAMPALSAADHGRTVAGAAAVAPGHGSPPEQMGATPRRGVKHRWPAATHRGRITACAPFSPPYA